MFPGRLAEGAQPSVLFDVLHTHDAAYTIVRDGLAIEVVENHDVVLPFVVGVLTSAALQELRNRYFLFHAGSVARGGRGLLLPAPSGSGKTTLVAALIQAGFGFLAEDVAVLDPSTAELHPFANSLF